MSERAPDEERGPDADQIAVVRVGHGANCSSIGSVVDTLFATATLGTAVFAAIVAALQREDVRIAGAPPPPPEPDQPEKTP